jgi:hypothetical protein
MAPRAQCVNKFERSLAGEIVAGLERAKQIDYRQMVQRHIGLLRGVNLACYCAPGTPCHGEAVFELANR